MSQRQQNGVGVSHRAALQQQPPRREVRHDRGVGVLREEAREGPAREAALQVDRLQEEQPVRAAQVVVVLAEGRRDVHDAGAVLHRDEVARQDAAPGRGLRVVQAGVTEAQHAVAPVAGFVEALVAHPDQRRPR